MKRKVFGIIAGLIILAGAITFSVNQQNDHENDGVVVQNLEDLATPDDEEEEKNYILPGWVTCPLDGFACDFARNGNTQIFDSDGY